MTFRDFVAVLAATCGKWLIVVSRWQVGGVAASAREATIAPTIWLVVLVDAALRQTGLSFPNLLARSSAVPRRLALSVILVALACVTADRCRAARRHP
jgi:hypothetical protein